MTSVSIEGVTSDGEANLSVPAPFRLPRPLSDVEVGTLRAVADVLVPASGARPAATDEPGYDEALSTAAAARSDAFEAVSGALARLGGLDTEALATALRTMAEDDADTFQPLSAIVCGAWLILPAVRERIGYPGQHRNPPRPDEAVDELSDGILDAVIDRGPRFVVAPD